MKTSNLYLKHTFHGNSEELSEFSKDDVLIKNNNKFYTVELNILGGHILKEFLDLNTTLEHFKNHNLVYRFVESTDNNENHKIIVLQNVIRSEKIVGYHNFYGIGEDWKLYINSKSDIVIQHMQFPQNDITIRFRDFPAGDDFYIYLSCLIYSVTNYRLETELEIKRTFKMVKDYATK